MSCSGLARPHRWLWHLDPDDRVVALLVAFSLARGLLYALLNPPFGSPDEDSHYRYVAYLYRPGLVGTPGPEAHQPPLYYWLSLAPFALAAGSTNVELLAMRLVSVLLTGGTVFLACRTARVVFPGNRLIYLGTPALLALVPAYGWIGASANNDNLANVAACGTIYWLMLGLSAGFTPGRLLGLLAFLGLCLGSKLSTLPVVATALAVLVAKGILWAVARKPAVTLFGTSVAILGATALLGGPLREVSTTVLNSLGIRDDFLSGERVSTFVSRLDAWPFVYQFKTFWVTFWSDVIQPPSPLYWALAVICLASAVGLVARIAAAVMGKLMGGNGSPTGGGAFTWQMLTLMAMVLAQWSLSFLRFYREMPLLPSARPAGFDYAFWALQGRFLFPVMVPVGLILLWGLSAWIPKRRAVTATVALVALLLTLDWIALGTLFVGYYAWPGH